MMRRPEPSGFKGDILNHECAQFRDPEHGIAHRCDDRSVSQSGQRVIPVGGEGGHNVRIPPLNAFHLPASPSLPLAAEPGEDGLAYGAYRGRLAGGLGLEPDGGHQLPGNSGRFPHIVQAGEVFGKRVIREGLPVQVVVETLQLPLVGGSGVGRDTGSRQLAGPGADPGQWSDSGRR